MGCSTITIFKGERRVVAVEFSTCDDAEFTIRNASYKLCYDDEVEASGEPVVEGHKLTMVIEPLKTVHYSLQCEVNIADEKVIRRVPVIVRD